MGGAYASGGKCSWHGACWLANGGIVDVMGKNGCQKDIAAGNGDINVGIGGIVAAKRVTGMGLCT